MKKTLKVLAVLGLLLIFWQLIIWIWQIPAYILPAPDLVIMTLNKNHLLIWQHLQVTLFTLLFSTLAGTVFGIVCGILMARYVWFKQLVFPILLLMQATPIFVLAPLLILWLGYGLFERALIVSLLVFFPIANSCYEGLTQIPEIWLLNARLLKANQWRVMRYLRWPACLPRLAGGLKIAASVAPLGCLTSEWMGASQGLGVLMLEASARMATELLYATVFVLLVVTVLFYGLVHVICRRFWQRYS